MSDKKPLVNYSGEIKEIASTDVIPVVNGGVDSTAWTSWTPTWTNITIGNATVNGKYKQIGKTVFARLDVTFGTTSSAITTGGTLHSFTLPVNAASRTAQALLGRGHAYTTQSFLPVVQYKSTSDVYLGFEVVVSTLPSISFNPIGWTNSYVLTLDLIYEAA